MVFIDRDGRVLNHRPWSLARLVEIFSGLWFILVQFFLTLTAPFRQDNNDLNRRTGSRSSGWGPGGGGGGGGGGGRGSGRGSGNNGGFNSGLRPNRHIGRINNTSMDCNIPGGG